MSKEPEAVELARLNQLEGELQRLRQKLATGGGEGRQAAAAALLAEVSKLARQIADAGDAVVKDEGDRKTQLQSQTRALEALIKRVGPVRG